MLRLESIETAPTDGSWIVAFIILEKTIVTAALARWEPDFHNWYVWGPSIIPLEDGYKITGHNGLMTLYPTYWMPTRVEEE